jgi:glycine cleavage system aminomethyltransferase T/glycine/D-amino acid oxidase-like deaminating enzyme
VSETTRSKRAIATPQPPDKKLELFSPGGYNSKSYEWSPPALSNSALFPTRADVVIVGVGGIVGASLAHFLGELGVRNVVGLEKAGAIPSDISSTSHASDFIFNTAHDKLANWTTAFSREFYQEQGFFFKRGGLEVCRVGDDARWEELKRKVGSGKAFGTNVRLISATEAKEKFPLLEESSIRGAMWDPDAGLVVPRSIDLVHDMVKRGVDDGFLRTFTNTPATGFEIEDGRITAVQTRQGSIEAPLVVVTSGIWGPEVAGLAGVPVPLWPVEHPLLFFGPLESIQGTDQFLVHPLLRDQGNSAYVRDTGFSEGGMLEWGYYEEREPRLVDVSDIGNPDRTKTSPSMRHLELDQVAEALTKASETVPILADLGWDERLSFNGLLSVTTDGGSLIGESPEVRGFWLCEAVWVKDGPGAARLCAEWIVNGAPSVDLHSADIARFYPIQKQPDQVRGRCFENAQTIYNPPVHPREPYLSGRDLYRSPFHARERELGGYFDNEIAGWERAYAYESNREQLADYLSKVPVRENEWDRRHVPYELANAEHLAMSDRVGMINLSHFAIFDIVGPDAEKLLEALSVAKVGGRKRIGSVIYTNFLNAFGGVQADLTICRRAENHYRVVTGGADGNRDWMWIRNHRDDWSLDADISIRTQDLATLGLWGPQAREVLGRFTTPEALSNEAFPFATARELELTLPNGLKIPVWAARISYVGEFGWELYLENDPAVGEPLFDAFLDAGVVPVGIETYATSRRLEKCFRLQGADLETEYNAFESGVARPATKAADFVGKESYVRQRDEKPAAILSTLSLDTLSLNGAIARYPVGFWPILDPTSKRTLVDDQGRRSYTTSASYCPSLGKFAVMGYLPRERARVGASLLLEYFDEMGDGHYPMTVEVVGRGSLYDPTHERIRG